MSNKPEGQQTMDKAQKSQNPAEKQGDVMSHSFGEGYATRSDEERFGGIYGGNQSVPKVDIDKEIHENNPAYDKSQGSEVKEKEKEKEKGRALPDKRRLLVADLFMCCRADDFVFVFSSFLKSTLCLVVTGPAKYRMDSKIPFTNLLQNF